MTGAASQPPHVNPQPHEIADILRKTGTIAVVGLSPKEDRDSNRVARYLMEQGYTVVPVNPGQSRILGLPCFRTLRDIPFPVDVADLFLNPARVADVVDQAIEIGVRVIWMQLGVIHEEAARKAAGAGIRVVMDRCIKLEHAAMIRP